MSEQIATEPSLEEWALEQIKKHLAEAQRLSHIIIDYRKQTGQESEIGVLEPVAAGISAVDLVNGIASLPASTPAISAPTKVVDTEAKLRERIRNTIQASKKSTKAGKYEPALEYWLRTPNRGLDNKEFFELVMKVVKNTGTQNAIMTFLHTLKTKRKVVVEHKGKNYLKGAILP